MRKGNGVRKSEKPDPRAEVRFFSGEKREEIKHI
jgi:hypothetical protein